MSRVVVAAMLAIASFIAPACAGSEEEEEESTTTVAADENLALVPRWWYIVGNESDATTETGFARTAAEKNAILARIRALKTEHCGASPSCRVGLTAMVCAPAIGPNNYCWPRLIAGHVGWQATVEALATFQREQVAFLEQNNVPARWVEDTLRRQRAYQNTVLEEIAEDSEAVNNARARIVNQARQRLGAMGHAVKGEETVRLANVRWSVGELSEATDEYEAGLARVRPLYADVAHRFTAYRDSEAAAIAALQALATRASSAELSDMAQLKTALDVISADENRVPQQLILDAERVRWELSYVQTEYDRHVEPHVEVLDSEGLSRLDHTAVPRDGMGRVVAYAEGRIGRINAAVREIFDGIERREDALVLVAADAATRDAAHAAAAAHAEAAFLNDITARIAAIWKTPPASAGLRLPLLGERVSLMQTFLQLETLCGGGTELATWRAPGCMRVANELPKVRRYLTQTLPFTIRLGITKLRAAGVSEAELAAIEAELAAGRTTAAVHRYDVAVRAVEEG